jgi:hypothetical protein
VIEETVAAQRRVLGRLVESLVYEGAVRPQSEPGRGSRDRLRLVGRDRGGDPVV